MNAIVARNENKYNAGNTAGLISAVVAALLALLKLVRERKDRQSFESGLLESLRRWGFVARAESGSLGQLYRHLSPDTKSKRPSSEDVVKQCLAVVGDTVAVVFNLPRDEITVNLALPDAGSNWLEVVMYDKELGNRQPGTIIYLTAPATNGAARAFIEKANQYIVDASKERHIPADAPYKAIMSWPLFGEGKDVVGVLNIDSPTMAAFDADTLEDNGRRERACLLCSPSARTAAVALLDPRAFTHTPK